MTTPSELDRLAERVEAATGPDRELDTDILIVLHPGSRRKALGEAFVPEKGWEPGSFSRIARTYTSSLDAAMSLVPEGREWQVRRALLLDGSWAAIARVGLNAAGNFGVNTTAATPALALTAACLRAAASKARADGGER